MNYGVASDGVVLCAVGMFVCFFVLFFVCFFVFFFFVFFFFKQKTAYEIRNCDWSSDVCSSDLSKAGVKIVCNELVYSLLSRAGEFEVFDLCAKNSIDVVGYSPLMQGLLTGKFASLDEISDYRLRTRSEERRVGKECRSRWSADH